MGRMQRAKGARLEREAALALQDVTGVLWERSARNGVAGAIDLVSQYPWSAYAVEVKGRHAISVIRWLEQAEQSGRPGVVMLREDHGGWCVLLRLDTASRLYHRRHPSSSEDFD